MQQSANLLVFLAFATQSVCVTSISTHAENVPRVESGARMDGNMLRGTAFVQASESDTSDSLEAASLDVSASDTMDAVLSSRLEKAEMLVEREREATEMQQKALKLLAEQQSTLLKREDALRAQLARQEAADSAYAKAGRKKAKHAQRGNRASTPAIVEHGTKHFSKKALRELSFAALGAIPLVVIAICFCAQQHIKKSAMMYKLPWKA